MKTEISNDTHPLNYYLQIVEAAKAAIADDMICENPTGIDFGSVYDGTFMVLNAGSIIVEIMAAGLDADMSEWLKKDNRLSLGSDDWLLFNGSESVFYVLSIRLANYDQQEAYGADHGVALGDAFKACDHLEQFVFADFETARKAWGAVAMCYNLDGV